MGAHNMGAPLSPPRASAARKRRLLDRLSGAGADAVHLLRMA